MNKGVQQDDTKVFLLNAFFLEGDENMLSFTKMHGCGNDYIYFNCFDQHISDIHHFAQVLSNRHIGVGGDGVVFIERSTQADAYMRMLNMDGSEGAMCGNAIRCVGKYLYEHQLCDKQHITIETKSGIKKLQLHVQNGKVLEVSVHMGKPNFMTSDIPVIFSKHQMIDEFLNIQGKAYQITCVSMGNPHAVVFCDEIDQLDLEELGPLFENHEIFPDRINTEFVRIINEHTMQMRVWERGSGETMACGTGACAAVSAAWATHRLKSNQEIEVRLRGGNLYITMCDDGILMRGNCVEVFEGYIKEDLYAN